MNADSSCENPPQAECFISVDVETSGPIPPSFSLLSIGACVSPVRESRQADLNSFYCTLKPLEGAGVDPAALQVTGFSLEELAQTGQEPIDAMRSFEEWIKAATGQANPVFVGLNAAFDWSFINYYFHRFLGLNPFGFSALDIKSLYMGTTGCSWADTRSSRMMKTLGLSQGKISHQALNDAQAQAELFLAIQEKAFNQL